MQSNQAVGINQNMTERIIRMVLGLILVAFVLYMKSLAPIVVWVLAIVGLLLLVTGASGYSFLWQIFKINTNK